MKVGDMKFIFLITVLCTLGACASSQQTKPDFSELRERSNRAHQSHSEVIRPKNKGRSTPAKNSARERRVKPKTKHRAASKYGVIRGEGSGSTRHEAVVSALQTVSAQVMSRVQGVTVTQDFEDDKESTGSVEQRLKAETAFPYAELIRIVDVQPSDIGFTVTAELDKGEAIDALSKGLLEETLRFDREIPRIEQALDTRDYAVLLSRRYNPSSFLKSRQLVERMLTGLGAEAPSKSVSKIKRLAKRVAKVRASARLKLTVRGKVSKTIRDTARTVFTEVLKRRGCQMTSDNQAGPETVDVQLRLKTRDHEEFDAQWVYLGFELKATTRAQRQVVASVNGMPEFAHGGGLGKAQAEQAVLKELGVRLKQKPELFDELVCAESF
jgi:hypothetical protein